MIASRCGDPVVVGTVVREQAGRAPEEHGLLVLWLARYMLSGAEMPRRVGLLRKTTRVALPLAVLLAGAETGQLIQEGR